MSRPGILTRYLAAFTVVGERRDGLWAEMCLDCALENFDGRRERWPGVETRVRRQGRNSGQLRGKDEDGRAKGWKIGNRIVASGSRSRIGSFLIGEEQ